MSSFENVLSKAVARGKPVASKRVDNNTYAERRGDDAVAIRLHQTDVVTYYRDGRLVLNSGGWRTITTKARINDWLPASIQLYSDRGVWRVAITNRLSGEDQRTVVPYVDGITLKQLSMLTWYPVEGTYPDATREEQIATARKKLDKDIKVFVDKLPAKAEQWAKELRETGRLETRGDCFYCQGIVTTGAGDVYRGADHLWSHLREGYLFPSLVLAALAAKGYRDPGLIFSMGVQRGGERLEQHLAKYLRKQLEPGQEPAAGDLDRTKLKGYVDQAVEVLEKPGDFGYFGGDETLWNTSAPTWTKHRDSENHEVANFEVVFNALKAEFPELVPDDLDEDGHPARDFNPPAPGAIYVFGAGHWAVGHIDQIVVPVKLDASRPVDVDNLHPAFIRVCEFGQQVRDYPVLEGAEEIVARLDLEDAHREIRQYIEGEATDGQVNTVYQALVNEHGEYPEYLETEQWYELLRDLDGVEPASWLVPATLTG